MKKILCLPVIISAFILNSNKAESQTLTNIVQDSLDQNSGGVSLTITGVGTNFMSGGAYAFLTSGLGDTVYCYYVDGPYFNDTVNMSWDIPCSYPEGTWSLVLFDNTDGFLTLSNAIVVYNGFLAEIAVQHPKCFGDTNGFVAVTNGVVAFNPDENRGGPSFNYLWYPGGETTDSITGLGPGTYSVVVTDNYTGCSDSVGVTLIDPPFFSVSYQSVNANCGQADGFAYIESISGGIAPYAISWWPSQSSNDTIYNLNEGSYGVMVIDSFECSVDFYFEIKEQLTLDLALVNTTCSNITGSAALSILNGTGPYEIFWTNGDYNTTNADSLMAGQYSVQATDAGGCYGASVFNIVATNGPQITSIITGAPSCNGIEDASIDITISGGIGPYTFLWSNGATSEDILNVPAGIYEVTVTDNNGCSVSSCISVADDTRLRIDYSGGLETACASSTGVAEVQYTGGVAPVSVQWDANAASQTGNFAYNLISGFYTVVVTDAIGCSDSAIVAINDFGGPSFTIDSTFASECGMSNGNVFVTHGGAGANCDYILVMNDSYGDGWNGAFLDVYVNGVPGNYSAIGYGTTAVISVPVGGTIELQYFPGTYENEVSYILYDCSGTQVFADGPFPLVGSVYTGIAPVPPANTWIWSNGELGEDLVNVNKGNYFYTLIGPGGCKTNTVINVPGVLPNGQEICMVTVDSASGNNLVVWEKAIVSDIDYYNIYREACGDINGLVFIGSVEYDSLSEFVDVAANAMVRSWRYRMTAVDFCGNESSVSAVHKTVHLAVNNGANNTAQLEWDSYQGFSYTDQIIWRYHNSTGWLIIDTVASNIHLYYDASPLAADTVEYVIEIYPNFPCVSTRAVNHNYTRSNRSGVAPPDATGKEDETQDEIISIFPNPSDGVFNMMIHTNKNVNSNLRIYDANGKLVRNQSLNLSTGTNNYQLSFENMASGIYQVVLVVDDNLIHARIVKN